ncbi:LAO/AO transport system kinase [Pustulibacterium marinum]|uniref:LAO/AO transport system kinase n=1 Tax=Pustulibacterium marinum TaxID=1224947 RepID=A0A1I7ISX9_9FLAO|nr:methylmalonyl Co-A mutase-associated GTPase MeaB [Pustulibacterium marinum]SFU76054.1 LAO/AO transport system kinase [Pustulibacterium marinum]
MKVKFKSRRLTAEAYTTGILKKDRVILSQAITLVESKLASDNNLAEEVINNIIPHTGNSLRIGITGVPGVGKSTFIESFGKYLTSKGKKLAVLTIDPSSQRSKGSILGDKTRMEELSNDPNAYVRPSASGTTLGGIHSKTRETILLCEAAGFDVILIETVGVGQSETSVKGLVDFFLLLMLSNAGDELQGIKRGIMEMADAIAINKVDGDNLQKGQLAKRQYQNALHMFPPNPNGWVPKVSTCSAIQNDGVEAIWKMIADFETAMKQNGFFEGNRKQQNLDWMQETIKYHLETDFYNHPEVKKAMEPMKELVINEKSPAITVAKRLLALYHENSNES